MVRDHDLAGLLPGTPQTILRKRSLPAVFHCSIFPKFERFEQEYRSLIHRFSRHYSQAQRQGQRLEQHMTSFLKEIDWILKEYPDVLGTLIPILRIYRADLVAMHQEIKDHLIQYCGLPVSVSHRDHYQQRHRQADIYNDLIAISRRYQHILRHRFLRIAASQAVIDDLSQCQSKDFSHLSQDMKGLLFSPRCPWRKAVRERIDDGILGYLPFPSAVRLELLKVTDHVLGRDILKWEHIQRKARWIKWGGWISALFLLFGLVQYTDIEQRTWSLLNNPFQGLASLFSSTVVSREKESFFEKQLLDLNVDDTKEQLLTNVRHFLENGMDQNADAYEIFAHHILKGYLILLARWEVDQDLVNQVLDAAERLDQEMKVALEEVTQLYLKASIHKSQLRRTMLQLRRILVHQGVYPFMFLVVNEQVPYVFIYPEEIIARMPLAGEALEQLSIPKAYARHYEQRGVQAYFVKGLRYPFKSAAGYYEGEFAIVFTSLSPNAYWTALHELGHVVEGMRYRFEGRAFPENIELNAVLLPLIFAPDRQAYLRQHVKSLLFRKDPRDYYAQAAKGIMNGMMIWQAERLNKATGPLISDRFEGERVAKALSMMEQFSSKEIHQMALAMYHNPQIYLKTAKKGRYHGVETNAEELIHGAHVSPERDMVQTGFSFAGENSRGPQLIHDGEDMEDEGTGRLAVMAFMLILSAQVALHVIGRPLRRKYFYGRPVKQILREVLKAETSLQNHSLEPQGSLARVFESLGKSPGEFSKRLNQELEDFKLVASQKEQALLNAGLTIAPFVPHRSRVLKDFHRIFFDIPIFGPYLARAPWLWPSQKHFWEREQFNAQIQKLVSAMNRQGDIHQMLCGLKRLVLQYEKEKQQWVEAQDSHWSVLISLLFKEVEQTMEKDKKRVHVIWGGFSSRVGGAVLKRSGKGTEFQHLQVYSPGDDFRDIDWHATARSVQGEVVVRKRLEEDEIKVTLLLDMHGIADEGYRKIWAQDFVRSLKVLGQDRSLEYLILVLPNNETIARRIQLSANLDYRQVILRTMQKVMQICRLYAQGSFYRKILGLRFYTDEENARYLRLITHTDFHFMDMLKKLRRVAVRDSCIFFVGVKPERRRLIASIMHRRNRCYFWQEQQAIPMTVY
jgi:hypothetical protein